MSALTSSSAKLVSKSNKKWKMATLDDSPSLYLGQPWSIWADKIEGKHKEGSGGKPDASSAKDDSNTMKLRIEDMAWFGLCPSRDEFYLVVCEHCKQVVKPQALKSHIESRHSRGSKRLSSSSTVQISPRLKEEGHTPSSRHDTHGKTPPGPPIGSKGGTKSGMSSKHKSAEGRTSNHALPSVTVELERITMPSPNSRQPPSTNTYSRSNSKQGSSSNGPLDDDNIINSRIAMQVASPPGGGVTGMTAHKSPPHMGVFPYPKPAFTERSRTSSTSERDRSSDRSFTEKSHDKSHDKLHDKSHDKSHERQSHGSDRTGHGSERDRLYSSDRQGSDKSDRLSHSDRHHSSDRHSSEKSRSDKSHSSEKSHSDKSSHDRHGSERSHGSEKSHSSHTSTATTTTTTTVTSGHSSVRSSHSGSRSSSSQADVTTTSSIAGIVPLSFTSPAVFKKQKLNKCIPCKDREFDPNVHCGAIIADTGKPCTRSLTCKSHALSLRRAVQGRCKPFDDLLREHREAKEKMIIQKYAEKGLPVPPKLLPSKSKSASSSSSQSSKPDSKQASPRQATVPAPAPSTPVTPAPVTKAPVLTSPPLLTSPTTTKVTKPPMLHSPTPVGLVKEDPIPETCSRLSSDGEDDTEEDKDDLPYRHIPYHPRPAAVNNFGSRLAGSGCFVFNRRTDLLRAAFMVAVEQHLHPPPHKKLCLESRLPHGSQITTNAKDPYEFSTVGESGQQGGRAASRIKHRTSSQSSASSPGRSSGKSRDGSGGRSPASSGSTLNLASSLNSSTLSGQSKQANGTGGHLKRKRPSSSSSPGVTLGSPPTGLPSLTTLGLPVSLAGQTSPISIAIPTGSVTVNLSSSTLSHLSVAKTGQLSHKNHLPKDLNIVVTNMDPSLMNGQIISSTGLTGSAGDVVKLQLNSLAEKSSNAKRARLNAGHQLNSVGVKLAGSVDGGVLNIPQVMFDPQSAVFTPVSLSTVSHSSLNSTSPTQTSPSSSTPSPLFSSCSTSPQLSATSPLPNGVVSSPTGVAVKLPVNHMSGAMSVSPSSNYGALSPNPLEASQPANRHHKGSGGLSRSSIGLQKAASMQQVMVSVSGGSPGVAAGGISLAGQPGGRLIPALYTGPILAPNTATSPFSQIQIQPKQMGNGQGKTVATGKLAVQPVSLTIPLMSQPVAMTQTQSQARLLLQGSTDDRHRHRDLQAQVQTSPS